MLSLTTGGCASPRHVKLEAPSDSASDQERVKAFDKMRAVSQRETHITYTNQYGGVVGASRSVDYLQLNNGERVYYAEDLVPVLHEESAARKAAQRSKDEYDAGKPYSTTGAVMMYTGLGVLAVSPLLILGATDSETGDLDLTPMWIGLGVGTVLSLAGLGVGLVGSSHMAEAARERETAFELYNEGLAQRLDVCVDDDVLVPCAGGVYAGGTTPEGDAEPVGETAGDEEPLDLGD